MSKFIGEIIVKQSDVLEFKHYTKADWVMYFISSYGQEDGSHHKGWVLDQVARILKGSEIEIRKASWDNGESEYHVNIVRPSEEYKQWVVQMGEGINGPETYSYDEGVAP